MAAFPGHLSAATPRTPARRLSIRISHRGVDLKYTEWLRSPDVCRAVSLLSTGLKNQEAAHRYHRNTSKSLSDLHPGRWTAAHPRRGRTSFGFPLLGLRWRRAHALLRLTGARQGEGCACSGGAVHPGGGTASSPSRRQKTAGETSRAVCITDRDTADRLARLVFQVNGALHGVTLLGP